jgi:DNA adenine methylase
MRFNGSDYQPAIDDARLGRQHERIRDLMLDGVWRTLDEIAAATGDPPASISAQLRHLRKPRFGSYVVAKQARGDREHGLFEYRLGASMENDRLQAPLWKWVGGKRWIAPRLAELITMRLGAGGTYYEPFVGAGAVALAFSSLGSQAPRMVLSDLCVPLAGLWSWIQADPARLFRAISPSWKNTEAFYYALRENFNANHYSNTDPTPSARFLWLNAAGFNGMYRENTEGKLNIPYGKRTTLTLPAQDDLLTVSTLLAETEIRIGVDFEDGLAGATKGDVVFSDPPYDVAPTDEAKFTAYTKSGFGQDQQARLARVHDQMRRSGVFVITTNADTVLIRDLYPERYWCVEPVSERRSIAADAEKRVEAECLVITSR